MVYHNISNKPENPDMAFNSIEEIIEDYRQGKMVLWWTTKTGKTKATCCSPPTCSAEAISFMAREARG
jgi:3,4-dihydroxy 2-butanone 4-phosphate synthase/GTP cyclohydrolase II